MSGGGLEFWAGLLGIRDPDDLAEIRQNDERTMIRDLLRLKFQPLTGSGRIDPLIDDMARILYTFHGEAAR